MIAAPLTRSWTRAGVAAEARVRRATAEVHREAGDDTFGAGLTESSHVTLDAMSAMPLFALRSRYTAGLDRDRILADQADVLLDDAERASIGQPRNVGEALLALTRERFADPSDALMALRELRKRTTLAEHADAFELAEQQLARLVPRRTLLSGANAALAARAYAGQFPEYGDAQPGGMRPTCLRATDLRALYRRFIEVCPAVLDLYGDWIILFNSAHRTVLIDFVRDALAADIEAADPSCTQAEFIVLTDALRALMRLRCVDLAFAGRLGAAAEQAGWPEGLQNGDLGSPFARLLVDGLGGASNPRGLVDWLTSAGCEMRAGRSRPIMVQALIAGFRLVPADLYGPAADRERLLEGLEAELTALAIEERACDRRGLVRRRP